ncbi:MAG: hypothetical protein WCS69_16280 [Ignavibacteriaceae bacterium]|jgi:hypothetical protein
MSCWEYLLNQSAPVHEGLVWDNKQVIIWVLKVAVSPYVISTQIYLNATTSLRDAAGGGTKGRICCSGMICSTNLHPRALYCWSGCKWSLVGVCNKRFYADTQQNPPHSPTFMATGKKRIGIETYKY